jgi:hypothetical protein
MNELDRRKFLKGAATGVLVGGLGFDTATLLGAERKEEGDTGAGRWLQFSGDRTLTGRSSLKGNIREPAIRWKQFCGASHKFVWSTSWHIPTLPDRSGKSAGRMWRSCWRRRWRRNPSIFIRSRRVPAARLEAVRAGILLVCVPGLE